MGDDMVVVFSFDAFARDELLAGHLVSFGGALTTQSSFSIEKSLVSSSGRILYRLFDSNTGGGWVEVVKTRPETWGGGIFECTIDKVSECDIKVSDRQQKKRVHQYVSPWLSQWNRALNDIFFYRLDLSVLAERLCWNRLDSTYRYLLGGAIFA